MVPFFLVGSIRIYEDSGWSSKNSRWHCYWKRW